MKIKTTIEIQDETVTTAEEFINTILALCKGEETTSIRISMYDGDVILIQKEEEC